MNIKNKKASKVVIEITTKEMFDNIIATHADLVWDGRPRSIGDDPETHGMSSMREYLHNLIAPTQERLNEMFHDGATMFLLGGEAMRAIEKAEVAEIIVTDHFNRKFTIAHENIEY